MTPTTNSRPAIGLFLVQMLLLGCVGTAPQNSHLESIESHSNPKMVLPGYVVKRPSGAKRVLVLIHGITGDGTSSWTNHNGTYWPEIMKGDSEFQDFDIYVYEYPTDVLGQCLPITDLANNMRVHLKNDNVFLEHEQVVFLAHSMGGLVVRQFLLRNRETVDKVPLVMFFATPTAGSWKANAASLLPTCAQVDDLRTLDVNSYLKAQHSDWLSAGLQERVISHCAFETRSSSGMTIVDRTSATLLCTRDPDALLTDHSDAVKPSGPNDLTHIIVRNALKDLPAPHNSRLDAPQENRELKKQVENLNSRLDQRFKNRTVREQLGIFIREGSAITSLITQKPPGPLPQTEATDWFARVRKYLLAHLDSSYEARFVSPDPGLPISYDLPTKDHKDLMHGMQIRLTALRRFIEELRD